MQKVLTRLRDKPFWINSEKEHKESKEPDYDNDKDQLEEEQEEETGEQETAY